MKKKLLLGVLAILTLSTITIVVVARNHTPLTIYGTLATMSTHTLIGPGMIPMMDG